MSITTTWLLLAGVQAAATISPGPAFAVSVRNALTHGRRAGLLTAMGLGIGVGAHVLFVLFGISVLISQSVTLFSIIKYAGAAYLVFIGIKSLLVKKEDRQDTSPDQKLRSKKTMSNWGALRNGILTNILNPKAVVFFTAVYAQFITPHTAPEIMTLYALTSVLIELGWFTLVTIFLTNPRIKGYFTAIAHWIERICGGLLVALGIRLAM